MQKMTSVLRIALLCAPVALAACQAMPSGYIYQSEVYKAPPGPEATPPVKIVKTESMHNQGSVTTILSTSEQQAALAGSYDDYGNTEAFRAVADDMVQQLVTGFGAPAEPIFVNQSSPLTAALKEALTRRNIPVAVNPGDGPFVLDHHVDGVGAAMTLFENKRRVTSVNGSYSVVPRN